MQLIEKGCQYSLTFVFAHGAGADMHHEFMDDMSTRLASQGIHVVCFNFPYMDKKTEDKKKRPPDREPVLIATFEKVLAQLDSQAVVVGGKSMGGRIASYLSSHPKVKGIACLGFPFHPPSKPEKFKGAHLADIAVPVCILQGERDAFGNKEDLAKYTFSSCVGVHFLPDGDHSLKPRKKSGLSEQENREQAALILHQFIAKVLA